MVISRRTERAVRREAQRDAAALDSLYVRLDAVGGYTSAALVMDIKGAPVWSLLYYYVLLGTTDVAFRAWFTLRILATRRRTIDECEVIYWAEVCKHALARFGEAVVRAAVREHDVGDVADAVRPKTPDLGMPAM